VSLDILLVQSAALVQIKSINVSSISPWSNLNTGIAQAESDWSICAFAVGVVVPIHTLPLASIVNLVSVPIAVVPILNLSLSPSSTHIVNTLVQDNAKASCGSQSVAEFDI
jgi:hypothetical protein